MISMYLQLMNKTVQENNLKEKGRTIAGDWCISERSNSKENYEVLKWELILKKKLKKVVWRKVKGKNYHPHKY